MKVKKAIAMATLVGVLGIVGVAYAATTKTPAEIAAGLTGKSVEAVTAERADGKTYGTIAKDAGKLEEFKQQILAQKKALLDERVKEGRLTQEQADQIYKNIEANQATCDATGNARMGKNAGLGCGQGQCGVGAGMGRGQGFGRGLGQGFQGNGTVQ